MDTVELLAPARDRETGLVAIDSGADAVYIGPPRFGARVDAGNSLEDIAALVEHAHTYWARVYVTVNTLLHDDELPQAVHLIHTLHEAGVDAVIIQDVGLLECDLPPIALIASTHLLEHEAERYDLSRHAGLWPTPAQVQSNGQNPSAARLHCCGYQPEEVGGLV